MSNDAKPGNHPNYLDIHKELCTSFRAIDDCRAKLLVIRLQRQSCKGMLPPKQYLVNEA